jgi:Rhs element Vgr protein
MSDDSLIPTPAPSDLVSFKILIGGNEIDGAYRVLSVDVMKIYNRISTAKIILFDGDTAEEDFKISNTEDFKPGNEVEILAGYHSDEKTIFKGIIIKHGIRAKKDKASQLVVEAKDISVKLTVGRKSAYFYDVSDSEIIEDICKKLSITADVESTSTKHKEMVQNYVTDWDFIVSRAEVNGLPVLTDDNKLIIKKINTKAAPVLTVTYGATLIEFEAEMDARTQYPAVKSFSWNYKEQAILDSEASDSSVKECGNITSTELSDVIGLSDYSLKHSGKIIDGELKSWSDAALLKSKLSKIRGRAKFQGFADVKPGSIVELKGVGDRFNGNVLISGIRHSIAEGVWETDIQFGMNNEWFYKNEDIVEKTASGLLPGINGLQIGVVVQLESDPDGEDRIQVRIPIIDAQEVGTWARVSTLDAGDTRGSFFRPEIGDEVVIGFINDDPRDAIVLGMLNSSAKPAPLQAADDNFQKGFFTKNKMKLLFDDEKKSVTIETPAGKSIVIDDDAGTITAKDENNNKIEMSSDGIMIESAADLKIKATGDVTIEGTNVSSKASAQLKAEGSAGAELSSGASAVVKGSIVQIN